MTSPSRATPAKSGKRTNRGWFAFMAMCPVVVIIVVLLEVFTTGSSPEPTARPLSHPAGYRTIADAYFAYVIPTGWTENKTYTDAAGDFFYGDRSGWAAENLSVLKTAPAPDRPAPKQLATYGVGRSTPYRLGPATPITVPGTTHAWRYQMTRAGGFQATVLQVWEGQSQTEMWLQIKGDPATTDAVVASLSGFVPSPKDRSRA